MSTDDPTTTSDRPKDPGDGALADAIAAEHATIYGYGFVSAHITPDLNELVSDSFSEHRGRREAAIAMMSAHGQTPPIAAVGYQLPIPVNNYRDAATLAVRMESDTAVAWRAVIEQATDGPERELGVKALRECAVRAARWRLVIEAWPLTVPFPGSNT